MHPYSIEAKRGFTRKMFFISYGLPYNPQLRQQFLFWSSIMLTREELIFYLNGKLEVSQFNDFSVNGLQIEGKQNIKRVATGVSASLATIEAAVEYKADALIVHHGIFWSKESYVIEKTKRLKIQLLLENEISLLAYHLPLDAHPLFGNNWRAAMDLGWECLEPFGYFQGKEIGVKGIFPKCSVDSFIDKLQKYYDHSAISVKGGKPLIQSAALISGGAYKELQTAAKEGLDCFITGNFDEPAWNWAFEEKIHFLALGHTATEKVGPRALAIHLRDSFRVEASFLEDNNPF
jgi:dinuclear metal center YbgI/SA1388 family protein